jgi:esterase/lipase superfamily enzyme
MVVTYSEALTLIVVAIYELLGIEGRSDTLLSDLVLGELKVRELKAMIEKHSGIEIAEDMIQSCPTVGELAVQLAQTETARQERVRLSPFQTEEQRADGSEYRVWFGTNRRANRLDGNVEFASERDSKIHYGTCKVYVPKSHVIGSLGSPWWKRFLSGTDDRLKLQSTREFTSDLYWSLLNETLKDTPIDDRDVLVFIHGYNVSFVDAALRAAQIGFDLSIKGVMAFFSWPSQGSTSAYMADEATIEASEAAITQFLVEVATRTEARAVHIIAHSMGNRGVLRAVSRIAANAEVRSRVRFNQIILAAPDIDTEVFQQLCNAYGSVAARTTLYVSAKDKAVGLSEWLHTFPRVGLMPPVCVVSGIDTVTVTNVDLTMLGHGYVAEAREVLQDMHSLITHGTAPDRRFGLRAATTEGGARFWIVGA